MQHGEIQKENFWSGLSQIFREVVLLKSNVKHIHTADDGYILSAFTIFTPHASCCDKKNKTGRRASERRTNKDFVPPLVSRFCVTNKKEMVESATMKSPYFLFCSWTNNVLHRSGLAIFVATTHRCSSCTLLRFASVSLPLLYLVPMFSVKYTTRAHWSQLFDMANAFHDAAEIFRAMCTIQSSAAVGCSAHQTDYHV